MARKPLTKPRKHASQQRSRATVDALIEATARILVREGFDSASTNRIAEQAGVSVGSLYQYFPSKEALVAAVIERHRQDILRVAHDMLPQVEGQSLQVAMRSVVAAGVAAHRADPKLHRVLAEQLPRTGKLENVDVFDRRNYALFRTYLERHRDEIRAVDLDLASFVCVTSIEAITHMAVLHNADTFSDEAMNALVDETARLIVSYLQPARVSPSA
jgi:AcrR family transcriptional regulator